MRRLRRLHRFQRFFIVLSLLLLLSIASLYLLLSSSNKATPPPKALLDERKAIDNLQLTLDRPPPPQPPPPGDLDESFPPRLDVDGDEEEEEERWTDRFSGASNHRQRALVDAFQHAWRAYKRHAWGHDYLAPITKQGKRWFGVGLQILDALDTIVIMGLREEYDEARLWIDKNLSFDINSDVNLFETTIRCLGGLMSAYHLTGDQLYLHHSIDLGRRLLGAFKTETGVPHSDVNLRSGEGHAPRWGPDSSTSEVSTIQLEFRDLARASGDERFARAVERVSQHLHRQPKQDGLVPIFINTQSGRLRASAAIGLGARGDSYYEYLLKQWIQLGSDPKSPLLADYLAAVAGMRKHLLRRTGKLGLLYVGELHRKRFVAKMDHLACFLPGTLALGYQAGVPGGAEHLAIAEQLIRTCFHMYNSTRTGLAPEIAYFSEDGDTGSDMQIHANDGHYLLRPETIESLFYLHRITANRTYVEWGWQIFESIERHARIDDRQGGGYASLSDVRIDAGGAASLTKHRDSMETFFLAETLKYLYLLFEDDARQTLPLNRYLFNTEAHLLPIAPPSGAAKSTTTTTSGGQPPIPAEFSNRVDID